MKRQGIEALADARPGPDGNANVRDAHGSIAPSVLFLSHSPRADQGSRFYRCAVAQKQLEGSGMRAHVVYAADARAELLDRADIIVASRLSFEGRLVTMLKDAQKRGKVVCGDLDDRLSPWDVDDTGYLRSRQRPKSAVSARKAEAERDMLRLLPLFDHVTVSTAGIAEQLASFGISAHLVPNVFDTTLHAPVRRERTRLSRLLLMSGTPTHDQDLRSIASGLGQFLAEHPDVECTLLGEVRVPAPLLGLRNVQKRAALPVAELYRYIAEFDVCLVPLEDTAFNDCKSALKFLECGALSVPVLASPRREYKALIRDGENGFLAADDASSFYAQLCALKSQPERLARGAAGAFQTVTREHTLTSRGAFLADLYRGFLAAKSGRSR